MRGLAANAFLGYCALRSAALFLKPEKLLTMFPEVAFSEDENATLVAMSSARAIADLMLACGLLSIGGVNGRMASFGVIFPMFFVNHVIDGLAYPPLVPVVAVNVVVLAANIYEYVSGSDKTSIGKWTYILMQGGFGLLFLSEQAFLVQDPFTFAEEGTIALYVGQKCGFIVGAILLMHAAVAFFGAPNGQVVAMVIVIFLFVKIMLIDNLHIPVAAIGMGALCSAICIYDALSASSETEKAKSI